ncbi:MAG TPA: hypothetical protein VN616_08910 [Puia sp.]|nr:hypothetical protein [Puia sp.]
MEVAFRTTEADYRAFYTYYFFRRNIAWLILVPVVGGLWIGAILSTIYPFHLWTYLMQVVIAASVIVLIQLIPYWTALIRLVRQTKATGVTERNFNITLEPDGFRVVSPGEDAKFWRWEAVRTAGSARGCVYVSMFHGVFYVIPRHSFLSGNDADNFTGYIRNGMEKVRGNSERSRKVRARRLRWWGLVGFVPNFGFIAGLILFFRGIFQFRDWRLVVIGVADCLFTVVFWSAFDRWEMNSGTFIKWWTKTSQDQLTNDFKNIEFYRFQHGVYPDSLPQIANPRGNVWINDPFYQGRAQGKGGHYYYEKVGDKYWLFSVGPDHQPFTKDDIFPRLEPGDTAKFGLLVRR